jgi:hypothetical protein
MMCLRKHHIKNCVRLLIVFFLLLPAALFAERKFWTGNGGDSNWSNPQNWSGVSLPLTTDDVLLDNSAQPLSYQVALPNGAVVLRTILIYPSPGRNIELILPATNTTTDAFTVTGPGYGIELNAGAVFRNASGLSSGESLQIADSMIIHNGGRYIHQTRASHANSILKFLSTAPGTELGIFDFDVPRASYTISISNRIYGCLELHANAHGAMVNYTGTGANPLLIRGNLRIGANVNMSVDLSGANGNIQVEGDFIQEGGQLNLASGTGDNTVLRVRGDLFQSPTASITETSSGNPVLELNGARRQEITMAGQILNQVGFRVNNIAGSVLLMPLKIPWRLELSQGSVSSSSNTMLILDSGCNLIIDSSRLTNVYVDGPLRKLGLNLEDHFLFPVGKIGNLRWLELKDARGNYTVEYFRDNPNFIGTHIGNGLDHISKLEYWTVFADGLINDQAKIELSFASIQSGGVTNPNYLNVAKFQSGEWDNAGHSGITGNSIQGSVLSGNTDFTAEDYTLASILDLENPLPLTSIDLQIKEISEETIFSWAIESPEIPDHFDLSEETGGQSILVAQIDAVQEQKRYSWICKNFLKKGDHFFRIRMVDIHGNGYAGKIVLFKKEGGNIRLSWVSPGISSVTGQLLIQSENQDTWKYEIISLQGRSVIKGILKLQEGKNYLSVETELVSTGVYVFRAVDSSGKFYSVIFKKD